MELQQGYVYAQVFAPKDRAFLTTAIGNLGTLSFTLA